MRNKLASTLIPVFAIILVGAGFLWASGTATSIQGAKEPKPIWEVDLTSFGYQGRPPVELRNEDIWGHWTYQQGVVFTDPKTIAAFFVIRDLTDPASAQRRATPADPYRLVAVFLTADKGELIRRLDWALPPGPEDVSQSFFYPATKGRFIVGIGNRLLLYSPDFELLASHDSVDELNAIASPAGDTILLQQTQEIGGEWVTRFDMLETEKLTVVKSWKGESDTSQAAWGDKRVTYSAGGLQLQVADSRPQSLLENQGGYYCGHQSFLREDVLTAVQCRGGERLFVVSTSGKIIQEFDLDLEQQDGPAVVSRDGRRFAFPTREWGSGRNPKRLTARVFNIGSPEPLLTVDVPRHFGTRKHTGTAYGDTRFGWGGLALSHGGDTLAVKSGPIVQMYQVPDKAPEALPVIGGPHEPVAASVSPSYGAAPTGPVLQALSWLPADTETVTVANGPFAFPKVGSGDDEEGETREREPKDTFESLPFLLLGMKNGVFQKHFKGETVLLGLEGSRNFRSPSGLGLGPFDGCTVAVFANDISGRASSFLNEASKIAARVDVMEGHSVAVFEEKWEQEMWTLFVAFPQPNIAIAASDEKYLREVLARMNGKRGPRALPNTLPEWKHVNPRARFWALRHYNKAGAATDPTNPMGGRKAGNMPDENGVGLTFQFDPGTSKTATIRYISDDPKALESVSKGLFPMESEPGFRQLRVGYRQVAPGVVEGSFDLSRTQPARLFTFVLMILLGHAVYV